MKIRLAKGVTENQFAKIVALVEKEQLCNPNFSGMNIDIQIDCDFNEIVGKYSDEISSIKLLQTIDNICAGHDQDWR